jgi:hypothetical protein
MSRITTIAVFVVLLSCLAVYAADVPKLLNYQGILTDTGGAPLDGMYDLVFSIYPDTASTTPLWSEPFEGMDVDAGLFNVILGGTVSIPDSVFDMPELYMGVQVGDDLEISPRMRITSVAYALRAAVADSAVKAAVADSAKSVHGGLSDGHSLDAVDGSPADVVYVGASGDVGIGTTDPARSLHVRGDLIRLDRAGSTAGISIHRFPSGDYTTPWKGFIMRVDAEGPNDGFFSIADWDSSVTGGSQERFLINTDGDVGIGTSTPAARLHVVTTGFETKIGDHPYAIHAVSTGSGYGVHGEVNDANGIGVNAENTGNGNLGHLAGENYGAYGRHGTSNNWGYLGGSGQGVHGYSASGVGTEGFTINGYGVEGSSVNGTGVYGENTTTGNYGTLGSSSYGVYGCGEGGNHGIRGYSTDGYGVYGTSATGRGVSAYSTYGTALYAGTGFGIAGHFSGDVDVASGDIEVTGGRVITPVLEITAGSDLSERFDVSQAGQDQELLPGMVVSIDSQSTGDLVISTSPYDPCVAGVISGAGNIEPGMLMGQRGTEADGATPVALTGRVYCWVDASYGPVVPGDLLTTSPTPGHAMKVSDNLRANGAIIGKAMSSLEDGRALVLVLVNLQ